MDCTEALSAGSLILILEVCRALPKIRGYIILPIELPYKERNSFIY